MIFCLDIFKDVTNLAKFFGVVKVIAKICLMRLGLHYL